MQTNRLCELVEELPEYIMWELKELGDYFSSIDELCENQDHIYYYDSCHNMSDVAKEILNESGDYQLIPAHLRDYFDYGAYGGDLYYGGDFIETDHGVYKIML